MNHPVSIQRPVRWPLALIGAAAVFFISYLGLAGVWHVLFIPENPQMVDLGTGPFPRLFLFYAGPAVLLAILAGKVSYHSLRGENVSEEIAAFVYEIGKIFTHVALWYGTLFLLLVFIGLGGFLGSVGIVLLAVFVLLSLMGFSAYYRENTPRYNTQSGDG